MEECIFCKIARGEIPSHKVYEDEHTFAFLDINPKSRYHTLVIPKEHYDTIFSIPEHEAVNVMKAVKKIADLYNEKLGLENAQIISNSGKHAQQEVPHLHFHIIARYPADGRDIISPPSHPGMREQFDEFIAALS